MQSTNITHSAPTKHQEKGITQLREKIIKSKDEEKIESNEKKKKRKERTIEMILKKKKHKNYTERTHQMKIQNEWQQHNNRNSETGSEIQYHNLQSHAKPYHLHTSLDFQ